MYGRLGGGGDFRLEYHKYKEKAQLRSFFKVPVIALTATSNKKIKEDVMSTFQLNNEDTDIISFSLNRQNIYLQCQKRESSDCDDDLKPLAVYMRANGKLSRSRVTVSQVFISMTHLLGDAA